MRHSPVGDAPTEIGPDTRVEEYSVRVSVSHLPWHVIRRPLSSLDHQETTFSRRALPYRCRMSRRLRNRFSNCRPGPYFGRAWRFCCLGGHYWLRGDPRRLCFHRQRSRCSLAFLNVEPRRVSQRKRLRTTRARLSAREATRTRLRWV